MNEDRYSQFIPDQQAGREKTQEVNQHLQCHTTLAFSDLLRAALKVFVVEFKLSAVSFHSLHSQCHPKFATVAGTKPANWRSSALAAPVRQSAAMD